MASVICISCLLMLVAAVAGEHGNAYSYNHFEGPVSGPAVKISVPHGLKHTGAYGQTFDFVAKPDYKFAYGVEDPHHGNSQRRKESRDGDRVQGEYSLIEPDGSLRVVKYTADHKNGFQAVVQHTPSQGYKPPTVTQYLVNHDQNEPAHETQPQQYVNEYPQVHQPQNDVSYQYGNSDTNNGYQKSNEGRQQSNEGSYQKSNEGGYQKTNENSRQQNNEGGRQSHSNEEDSPKREDSPKHSERYYDSDSSREGYDGSNEGSEGSRAKSEGSSRYRSEGLRERDDDSRQRGHDDDDESNERGY